MQTDYADHRYVFYRHGLQGHAQRELGERTIQQSSFHRSSLIENSGIVSQLYVISIS